MAESTRYSRERLALYALLALAAFGVTLSLIVASPFLPGLTWALAFAVVGHPIHQWMTRRIKHDGLAAGLSVTVVVVVIVCPTVFVGWQVGREFSEHIMAVGGQVQSGEWQRQIEERPRVSAVYRWLITNTNAEEQLKAATDSVQQRAGRWLRNVATGIVQLLIALFALFYFFRDQDQVLALIRSLLPLSHAEADDFLERIRGMTHATIYGTVVVAAVQGALGGLMFAFLGIPGAVLWGVAMGVLAIVPVLGAFVIWLPAAGGPRAARPVGQGADPNGLGNDHCRSYRQPALPDAGGQRSAATYIASVHRHRGRARDVRWRWRRPRTSDPRGHCSHS